MCGFCGFQLDQSKYTNSELKNILFEMNNALSHRGPDEEGYEIIDDKKLYLGHKRLSIIDLHKRNNQPFLDKANQISLVFNGEIYNYLELKEILKKKYRFVTTGDTEVLVAAYHVWGVELLKKIKGMFSFCILDKKKDLLFCARDHFGQKPFHYYYDKNNFIFSSELKSLLKHPLIEKKLDINSTLNYLHYDAYIGSESPIKNCFKLNPSEFLIYDFKKKILKIDKYWKLNYEESGVNKKEFSNKFIDLFKQSINSHLRSDVPIGIYLSGGIDSTSIAYIASKKLNYKNLTAFNLEFGNRTFDENIEAQKTAKKLDINLINHKIELNDQLKKFKSLIENLDEPLADPGYLAVGMIAEVAKKHNFKVIISGDGGDELFGGYEPFLKLNIFNIVKNSNLLKKLISFYNKFSKDSFDYMGFNYKLRVFSKGFISNDDYYNSRWLCSFTPNEIKKLIKLNNSEITQVDDLSIYKYVKKLINFAKDNSNEYVKLLSQYQNHYLPNLICSHTDKANMIHSIEARSPFLDKDLFEYTNSKNKDLKNTNGKSKIILRNLLNQNDFKHVGKAKKKGFTVPIASWIKNELKEEFLDILNSKELKNLDIINHKYLSQILNEHLKGKRNNYKKIYNLYVLFKWIKYNKIIL